MQIFVSCIFLFEAKIISSHILLLFTYLAAKMGNGGDLMLDSGHSEAGSSGSISLTSASSDHLSGSIALSTGTGKQGSSGMISLETGSSDHSAGGIKLQVGDTFGYRNGGASNGGKVVHNHLQIQLLTFDFFIL